MINQDYEAMAALIKAQRNWSGVGQIGDGWSDDVWRDDLLDELARDMAQYLSRNPHFDQAKFLAAAGVQ